MTLSYTLSPWKLTDLFPAHDSPEMEAAIADLQAKSPSLSPCVRN